MNEQIKTHGGGNTEANWAPNERSNQVNDFIICKIGNRIKFQIAPCERRRSKEILKAEVLLVFLPVLVNFKRETSVALITAITWRNCAKDKLVISFSGL